MAKSSEVPEKSLGGKASGVREAFDNATRWFGNILAPLVIVSYAKDVQLAFDFIMERPVLTSGVTILFVLVFGYNIVRNLYAQFGTQPPKPNVLTGEGAVSSAPARSVYRANEDRAEDTTNKSGRKFGLSIRSIATIGSFIALALVVYIYVAVFVTGIFYVVVASAPNEASAIREIQVLNQIFERSGYSDLRARAHESTATGSPWYMISIGGWHASRDAAEETFKRARAVLGDRLRSDAYIYSTEHLSPRIIIYGSLRRLLE